MKRRNIEGLEEKLWQSARENRRESAPVLPKEFTTDVLRRIRLEKAGHNDELETLSFRAVVLSLASAACIFLVVVSQAALPTLDTISGIVTDAMVIGGEVL
jgi:hypothetical protein